MKTNSIQQNYFDALFYANSTSTEKLDYHISPVEFKILLKLIHYSSNQKNITWQSKEISIHTSIPIGAIDKAIQRLNQKGYITTSTYQIENKIKHRTIFVNWDKIELINKKYKESLNNFEIIKKVETTDIINGTYKEIETAAPIEIIKVIETIQPEVKAPQIKEKVSIIEDDEDLPLEISALQNLKEILDNQYPMKNDIERQLMIIAKNSSSYQINELYKKIKSDKIKSDLIEEFLENNIN